MKRSGGGIKGKPETQLKNLASTPTRKIYGEWCKRKLEEKRDFALNLMILKIIIIILIKIEKCLKKYLNLKKKIKEEN